MAYISEVGNNADYRGTRHFNNNGNAGPTDKKKHDIFLEKKNQRKTDFYSLVLFWHEANKNNLLCTCTFYWNTFWLKLNPYSIFTTGDSFVPRDFITSVARICCLRLVHSYVHCFYFAILWVLQRTTIYK